MNTLFPTELDIRLDHIGFNTSCAEEAEKLALYLELLFGLKTHPGKSSQWAGTIFELSENGRGQHGHICLTVKSVEQLLGHLDSLGVFPDMSTAKYAGDGRLSNIYLSEEIAGFAFHIKRMLNG